MSMQDRRKEFKNEYWSQGRVLDTPTTRRWNKEQLRQGNEFEKRYAFARFNVIDAGKGRIFLHQYRTARQCIKSITKHNSRLDRSKAIRRFLRGLRLWFAGIVRKKAGSVKVIVGLDRSNGFDKGMKVSGYKDSDGVIHITKIEEI